MTYFTSWDINVYLCLLRILPGDIVKDMMKMVKKKHESYCFEEAKTYWEENSPRLVRFENGETLISLRYHISELLDHPQTRINVYNRRRKNTIEYKKEWRYRSVTDRQKKVVDWCRYGARGDQIVVRNRLTIRNPSHFYKNDYSNNLWETWNAWGYCEHPPRIHGIDPLPPQDEERRKYVSEWYEGIHPGRFFLFFKENEIFKERNRDLQKGPCKDGYTYPKVPIFEMGAYEQLIEDLRCLDGPGIGESVGPTVEHIDDLFN